MYPVGIWALVPSVYSRVRSIIGAVVLLVNPLPPSAIAALVGLDPREIILFLTPVQSLLTLGEDFAQPVKPFHKSFPDFITDPSRCTDTRFYTSPRNLHFELAMNCLRIMNGGLEQNLLLLPDYALNSEVEDLETRINARISIALRYACRSWHSHLIKTEGNVSGVVSHLRIFLEEKFLAWLEVVSAVGAVGGAVVGLENLMFWLQEVVKSEQLLNIAKDCFQFVTNFFEVINVSATHIYHSALGLCPTSSIIRKLYYHRRVTLSPTVVIGTPESWAQNTGISGKDSYIGLCTWSPCGQLVAAQTRKVVEIRNQLTLELVTVLQPTENTSHLTGPLAYSPDGRFIACALNLAIVIWDIQTGGVAREIRSSANNISLAWSSDGQTICTIDSEGRRDFIVHMYDVSSGTVSFPGTLRSGDNPHLWTVDESFRVMTTVRSRSRLDTVDIFEVGSTLTKIQSFSPLLSNAKNMSFSPTSYHISISDDSTLCIFDIRNSECLLHTEGHFLSLCFSPDGSLFAAYQNNVVWVWKYGSGRYTPCGELQCRGLSDPLLQFSPTPSSILCHSRDILQVWRLHGLPTSHETRHGQYVGLSRSGTRVATSNKMESIVTTTDILAQTPPQFIDTDVAIEGLVLTGNVLLVAGSNQIVAWLLTEGGLVDGVIGDRRVDRKDSIWAIRFQFGMCAFRVEGQVGVIRTDGNALHVYHTDTGEVLHPRVSRGDWDRLDDLHLGRSYLRFHNLSQYNTPLEDMWKTSQATLREGWVKDAEGKHRLWVPVEWRTFWDPKDWRHDVTTQLSYLGDRLALIKF